MCTQRSSALPPRPSPEYGGASDVLGGLWDPAAVTELDPSRRSQAVENRPGAGTTTATAFVAKSDPDGFTIPVNSSAHTVAPALYPRLSYHPARDFAGVVPLGIASSVLVVPPAREFKTAAEFVAAAKAKPGAMNFATPGVGTGLHLSALRFQSSAGIQAVPQACLLSHAVTPPSWRSSSSSAQWRPCVHN